MTITDTSMLWRKARPLEHPKVRYPGFGPATSQLLKKGHRLHSKAKEFSCDVIFESNVPVKLRDGTTIYTDIFRPADLPPGQAPAVVAWSPYGKQQGVSVLDDFPFRAGVSKECLSDYQKWEAPDPAYWCSHGYAVVNPDARGAYKSEGDIVAWGPQESQDAYDLIEWLATLAWCNGKVGLAGNSWLAISQWFIAAARPPHLSAIAPWEGFTDVYRHHVTIGGITDTGFIEDVFEGQPGEGRLEDVPRMARTQPLFNDYWESKRAKVEDINVPCYVTASWTNIVHTPGTFDGWQRLKVRDRWLRVHKTMEWSDFYAHQDDLRKFFDRYLKGLQNGWEETPKVRIECLDLPGKAPVSLTANAYPFPNTKYQHLYLDAATHQLKQQGDGQDAKTSYNNTDGLAKVTFRHVFDRDTTVVGPVSVKLWVSTDGADDADVFIKLSATNARGEPHAIRTIPIKGLLGTVATTALRLLKRREAGFLFYDGAWGRIRASHRRINPDLSTTAVPVLDHTSACLLGKGEIVPLEIALTPMGMAFKAGDAIRLDISGLNLQPWPMSHIPVTAPFNTGTTIIHTGVTHPSCLVIPTV